MNQNQPKTFRAIQSTYGRSADQAAEQVQGLSLSPAEEARLAFSVLLTALQDWLRGDEDARSFLFEAEREQQLCFWLDLAQWGSHSGALSDFREWAGRNDPQRAHAGPQRRRAVSDQFTADVSPRELLSSAVG